MFPVVRFNDRVIIFNTSDQDCPSIITGKVMSGTISSVFAGNQPVAVLGSKCQLDCACGDGTAIFITASTKVFAASKGVARFTPQDRLKSGCGMGVAVEGIQTVLAG